MYAAKVAKVPLGLAIPALEFGSTPPSGILDPADCILSLSSCNNCSAEVTSPPSCSNLDSIPPPS